MKLRALSVVISSLAAVCLLGGCSAPAQSPSQDGSGGASQRFDGPWADLFESTYAESTSAIERQALEDGEITEQEVAFFQDAIVTCLKGLGIDAGFNTEQNLEYTFEEEKNSQDQVTSCERDNGIRIVILKRAMDRNPSNLDESTMIVDCLRRAKVVPAGYTAHDLAQGKDIEVIGTAEGFDECNRDPLNYAKG